jgi:hypothetical protein
VRSPEDMERNQLSKGTHKLGTTKGREGLVRTKKERRGGDFSR